MTHLMAACKGKERYGSHEAAAEVLRRTRNRRRTRRRAGALCVYFCSFCGGWHIGRKRSC